MPHKHAQNDQKMVNENSHNNPTRSRTRQYGNVWPSGPTHYEKNNGSQKGYNITTRNARNQPSEPHRLMNNMKSQHITPRRSWSVPSDQSDGSSNHSRNSSVSQSNSSQHSRGSSKSQIGSNNQFNRGNRGNTSRQTRQDLGSRHVENWSSKNGRFSRVEFHHRPKGQVSYKEQYSDKMSNEFYPCPPVMYRPRERRNAVADYDPYREIDKKTEVRQNDCKPTNAAPGYERCQKDGVSRFGSNLESRNNQSSQTHNRSRYDRFQESNLVRSSNVNPHGFRSSHVTMQGQEKSQQQFFNQINQGLKFLCLDVKQPDCSLADRGAGNDSNMHNRIISNASLNNLNDPNYKTSQKHENDKLTVTNFQHLVSNQDIANNESHDCNFKQKATNNYETNQWSTADQDDLNITSWVEDHIDIPGKDNSDSDIYSHPERSADIDMTDKMFELSNGLISDLEIEMARAEMLNLPFKRKDNSKLNPKATEFHPSPVVTKDNRHQKLDSNKYKLNDNVCNAKCLSHNAFVPTESSPQLSSLSTGIPHQNPSFPTQGTDERGFQPMSVYSPSFVQPTGNIIVQPHVPTQNTSPMFLPATCVGPECQISQRNFEATSFPITSYQNCVYNQSGLQNGISASIVSPYFHTPSPPVVVPISSYDQTSPFVVSDNYHTQELSPSVVIGTPVTPLPLIATPVTPVGFYNDGHFTFQVANLPSQPNNQQDLSMQTQPQNFQQAPVLNFQSYCMTLNDDQHTPYSQTIEELVNKNKVETKRSLMDRVGDTIKEVQQSIKSSKVRKVEAQENSYWVEILEKLIKHPPKFQGQNNIDEIKHLEKLKEVISSYIMEVKSESSDSMSEYDIFQDVLSLSWPIANMDPRNASGNSTSLDLMPETESSTLDKARVERMNRTRASLKKTWYDLTMSISKKSYLNNSKHNFITNMVNSNDLPQCDQGQTLVHQEHNMHSNHQNICEMPDVLGVGIKQNPTTQSSTSELDSQFDDKIHHLEQEFNNSESRRQSMGKVNVGTRISYFESNAQHATRHSRAKQ